MAQQTAIEWLAKKFEECELMYGTIQSLIHKQYLDGIIKQAKQMEKEQICDALDFGKVCLLQSNYKSAEQYYKETYGTEINA